MRQKMFLMGANVEADLHSQIHEGTLFSSRAADLVEDGFVTRTRVLPEAFFSGRTGVMLPAPCAAPFVIPAWYRVW